jgi:hypothetical protein
MSNRFFMPRASAFDINGDPISGGKLWFYEAGTSTPRATYSDAGLTIANANPVVANSAGRFGEIFLTPAVGYKVVLTDADDAVIWTADPYDSAAQEASTSTLLSSPRNRIINGGMRVAQRGTGNFDCTTDDTYTLDRWVGYLSSSPGGTLRITQNLTTTPGGSPQRLRASVQVADGTIAASDFYTITQRIEGGFVPDALFGTIEAKPLIVRFGVRSSISGTFGFSISNNARNRSYVTTFTVAPAEINTDLSKIISIPGDVAGTWLVGELIGFECRWCLAAGTDMRGTINTWQAGDFLTTTAQTNFMGSGGAVFDLFDVGLYVDVAEIGEAPEWTPAILPEEQAICRRYWQRAVSSGRFEASGAAQFFAIHMYFPPMRAVPTVSMQSTVASSVNVDAGYPTAGPVNAESVTINVVSAASGDVQEIGRVWHIDADL